MRALLIRKTDECVDFNKVNIKEQIEDIIDDPNICESFKFTDNESFLKNVHDKLGNPKTGITACNISETKDFIYAGYYVDVIDQNINQDINKDNINTFGLQITSQHVSGNLIVVKKKLSYVIKDSNVKTETQLDTLTENEFVNVLENVFIKNGVIIKPDGSLGTYKYIQNPLEHLILTDSDYEKHYVYHEYEVYTHVIILVVDTRETNGVFNSTATLLAGRPVNGIVYVGMYKKPEFNEHPPYVSLSVDVLKKILSIRSKSVQLTTKFERSDREYVNFEKILELEENKHSNKNDIDPKSITGDLLNNDK